MQTVAGLAAGLPQLARQARWRELLNAASLLLWLCQHVPGAAGALVGARGAACIQGGRGRALAAAERWRLVARREVASTAQQQASAASAAVTASCHCRAARALQR